MTACRTRTSPRRGAALLLVLVALAVGLLLVATWLDGRRESVPVAQRVGDAAVARLAAASGLDLAVATIDAEHDWRSALDDGRFTDAVDLAGARCTFAIADADTESRPDDQTVRLRIACTARLDEIVATEEGVVEVGAANPILDLGLGETAIVVNGTLRIDDEAVLLPWAARPGSGDGPLVVGSLDGRPEAVIVADGAIALDAEVLLVDDRSTSGTPGGMRRLPDPLPPIGTPAVPEPDPARTLAGRDPIDLVDAPNADVVSTRVRVPGSGRLLVDGDRVIRSLGDLVLEHGATIRVETGTLVLDAVRDLSIRGSEIVVADGARLVLRAGRDLRFDDAIVVPEPISPAEAGGEFAPIDRDVADAILVTVAGSDADIEIGGRSAIVLAIVAPGADVVVEDEAVVHGRIMAADVELRHRATMYARPDDGRLVGLTTPVGPHRDEDGRLLEPVSTAAGGAGAELALAAAATGLEVVRLDRSATPDAETLERLRETVSERLRRAVEERRRHRPGRRWARGREDDR